LTVRELEGVEENVKSIQGFTGKRHHCGGKQKTKPRLLRAVLLCKEQGAGLADIKPGKERSAKGDLKNRESNLGKQCRFQDS